MKDDKKKIKEVKFVPNIGGYLVEVLFVKTKPEMRNTILLPMQEKEMKDKNISLEMFIEHPYQARVIAVYEAVDNGGLVVGSKPKYKEEDIVAYQPEGIHPIRMNDKSYALLQDHAIKGKFEETGKMIDVNININAKRK